MDSVYQNILGAPATRLYASSMLRRHSPAYLAFQERYIDLDLKIENGQGGDAEFMVDRGLVAQFSWTASELQHACADDGRAFSDYRICDFLEED